MKSTKKLVESQRKKEPELKEKKVFLIILVARPFSGPTGYKEKGEQKCF